MNTVNKYGKYESEQIAQKLDDFITDFCLKSGMHMDAVDGLAEAIVGWATVTPPNHCPHCGRYDPPQKYRMRCQCWNDE